MCDPRRAQLAFCRWRQIVYKPLDCPRSPFPSLSPRPRIPTTDRLRHFAIPTRPAESTLLRPECADKGLPSARLHACRYPSLTLRPRRPGLFSNTKTAPPGVSLRQYLLASSSAPMMAGQSYDFLPRRSGLSMSNSSGSNNGLGAFGHGNISASPITLSSMDDDPDGLKRRQQQFEYTMQDIHVGFFGLEGGGQRFCVLRAVRAARAANADA